MKDTAAFVPIVSVVDSFMNATGIYSLANRRRFLKIVAENYADLNINSTSLFKEARLTIDKLNSIPWPTDFVDYVRIGTPAGNEIHTLTLNEKISSNIVMVCGKDDQQSPLSNIENDCWVAAYGATGGHNFMYYRSDKKTHRIFFQGDGIGRTVILQYISSGISATGQTYIPQAMVKLLRKYLHWVYMDYDMVKTWPQNKIQQARQDFVIFRDEYERMDNGFTAEEFLDALRSTYTQAIKN
jgi:hypothetical protein